MGGGGERRACASLQAHLFECTPPPYPARGGLLTVIPVYALGEGSGWWCLSSHGCVCVCGYRVSGIVPYRAIYFGGYDGMKALFLSDKEKAANFW